MSNHRRPTARGTTLAALVALVAILLSPPAPALAAQPSITATTVQSGLSVPWDVGFTPRARMLVTERGGTLRVYAGGWWHAPLLATFTIPDVHAEGEAGLLGLAVDVDYSSNRFIYLCASRDVGGEWVNQVLRYRFVNMQLTDQRVILSDMVAATIHNGCALEMSDDGRLWISMGDAGVGLRAQDPDSYNGKILRVTRSGHVPPDNPILAGASGRSAVYSMGHRNPQGIAIRPSDGAVFAVEHGPSLDDEINRIVAGGNYGWPCFTGASNPFSDNAICGDASGYEEPIWSSGAPTLATSGGAFRTGSRWKGWNGKLFVASLKQSDLRRFSVNDAGTLAEQRGVMFDGRWGRLRAVVRGRNGTLYLTTSNASVPGSDLVIRLKPD